jgi:hypothetical protein
MKVRVLYPQAFQGITEDEPVAGEVVSVEDSIAEALFAQGYAERENAKPPVEKATAAPGEARPARKKRS